MWSESKHGTTEPRTVGFEPNSTSLDKHDHCPEILKVEDAEESEKVHKEMEGSVLLKTASEKMKRLLNTDELDEETTRMIEREWWF